MDKKQTRVAVLLASYNCNKWLPAQLTSIVEQSGIDLIIFVSDDCSLDSSLKYLQKFAGTNCEVRLLPQTTPSGSAGQNFYRLIREVDFSGFDYIAFSDQDDVWLPNKLGRACEQLTLAKADGYSSNVLAFWPDGSQKFIDKSQPQKKYDFLFESAGPGCTFVITPWLANEVKQHLIRTGAVASSVVLHDWLTYAVCRGNDKYWVIDAVPSMMYRQHDSNVLGANKGFKAFSARVLKVKRGWYRAEVIKICQVSASVSSDLMFTFILDCLKNKRYFSSLRLLPYVQHFRRAPLDRLGLAFMILLGLF